MKIDGMPVLEAKKPITLKITKRDVSTAKTKDPGSCAAARCCLRQPKDKTAPGLRQEIITFDRGGTFEPGVYELKPLSEWERASGRRQGSGAKGARDAGSKDRTPKTTRKYHKVAGIRSSAIEYAA
jgi:hypothetical protein